MNQDALVSLLRAKVKEEGGAVRFSVNHDVSLGYVQQVMCGWAKPGPKIAQALGLKKVVVFEPIK